jgi:hypothetical protein
LNFGGWISLDEAPAAAPEVAGLLQARADGLLAYPRGKSAMVMYARCHPEETLRRYVADRGSGALGLASARGARWVRYGASSDPDLDYHRLLRRFVDRFGAPPVANTETDEEARFTDG